MEVGDSGERIALSFLKKKGLKPIETNWKGRNTEIDIIAVRQKELHIVEVKSRTMESWECVGSAINNTKITALRRGAVSYVQQHKKYNGYNIIFDIVVVFFNKEGDPKIEFVENIRF